MPRGIVRPVGYEDTVQSEVQRAAMNVLDYVHLHQMLSSEHEHERDYARGELKEWDLTPLEKKVLTDFAGFHVGAMTDWYGNHREITIELRAEDGSGVRRFTGEALGFGQDPDSRQVAYVALSVDPEVVQERS